MEKLSEGEWKLMELLWEESPINSTLLVSRCQERLNWSKSTTYTVLRRLCRKGAAANEEATVTPLISREAVLKAARETGRIITWEDHLMNNGLSSAVSDVLTDNCVALKSFKRFGIPQVYPGFGDSQELYHKYGYDGEAVQNYILELFGKN